MGQFRTGRARVPKTCGRSRITELEQSGDDAPVDRALSETFAAIPRTWIGCFPGIRVGRELRAAGILRVALRSRRPGQRSALLQVLRMVEDRAAGQLGVAAAFGPLPRCTTLKGRAIRSRVDEAGERSATQLGV